MLQYCVWSDVLLGVTVYLWVVACARADDLCGLAEVSLRCCSLKAVAGDGLATCVRYPDDVRVMACADFATGLWVGAGSSWRAWERPERLEFLNPRSAGVAF